MCQQDLTLQHVVTDRIPEKLIFQIVVANMSSHQGYSHDVLPDMHGSHASYNPYHWCVLWWFLYLSLLHGISAHFIFEQTKAVPIHTVDGRKPPTWRISLGVFWCISTASPECWSIKTRWWQLNFFRLGEMIQFDLRIFFRWVGSTTN